MRIVAGKHRGRPLTSPPGWDIRPTSDRLRETLFNILIHGGFREDGTSPLVGARVLDAFCGTGALGLEALSRGAGHAVLMDNHGEAIAAARRNAETLGETKNVTLLKADALSPGRAPASCALFFLDPPYGSGLAEPALSALAANGWLEEKAIGAVELGTKEAINLPPQFKIVKERRQRGGRLVFLRHDAAG